MTTYQLGDLVRPEDSEPARVIRVVNGATGSRYVLASARDIQWPHSALTLAHALRCPGCWYSGLDRERDPMRAACKFHCQSCGGTGEQCDDGSVTFAPQPYCASAACSGPRQSGALIKDGDRFRVVFPSSGPSPRGVTSMHLLDAAVARAPVPPAPQTHREQMIADAMTALLGEAHCPSCHGRATQVMRREDQPTPDIRIECEACLCSLTISDAAWLHSEEPRRALFRVLERHGWRRGAGLSLGARVLMDSPSVTTPVSGSEPTKGRAHETAPVARDRVGQVQRAYGIESGPGISPGGPRPVVRREHPGMTHYWDPEDKDTD